MSRAPIGTSDDLAEVISSALKDSKFELYDFGGGIKAVPSTLPGGDDLAVKILIVKKAHDAV